MARYLITGIAGFIGSSLAHTLVEQGSPRLRHPDYGTFPTGNLANLEDIRQPQSTSSR